MYMTSFMFLVMPYASLSTIVKHPGLTGCPAERLWWCMGDGALGFAWFSYVLLWAVNVWTLKPVYDSTFWSLLTLSLGAMKRVLMELLPFKMHLDPQAVAGPFELLSNSVYVWYHSEDIFDVDPLLLDSLLITIVDVVFKVEFVL